MDLESLRVIIDDCDKRIVEAFEERFLAVLGVGEYKRKNNLPIFQENREKEVLEKVKSYLKTEEFSEEIASLYEKVLKLSKKIQKEKLESMNIDNERQD